MYLGIDLGTSSVKAVIVDDGEVVVAQASAPLGVSRPQPLYSEQDAGDWWSATVHAILELPDSVRASVRAIGLSGQMHGATLLDRADVPLRPAILWNDGRSGAQCVELERREPQSRTITGNIMMPGFTAPKLLWVAQHEPALFARTATVLLPKDYLRLKLTGARVSEMSDASGTGWLDVARRDWSDAMLTATGLSRAHMPRLVEGNAPSGRLTPQAAQLLGMNRVPVAGGGGDNAASAVGMGVIAPGQSFLSLGTSGVLFVVTDRFRPNPQRAAHAFCHALPGCWHQMAVLLSAASALDWVAQLLGTTDLPQLVASAQARGVRAESPYFLPYLSGERTPHNDPHARGVFFGLGHATVPADLVGAVLEGVALAFADGLDVLLEAGGRVDEISMTGGGARLSYWGELLAAALNRPLTYRAGSEIGAALGAARLARMAVTGEVAAAVCRLPPIARVVQPDPTLVALLGQRRGHFMRLYRDLRKVFQESAG
ncbi:MAG TPA: xylulokinase [Steroidobacteraceae bacterium]|jgi:xylulokinase|nr:xylulokinase [Steroidobacteraceae bacterium]